MYKDLTGQRFGKRVVLKREGINRWREALWSFRCDCGGTGVTTTGSLKKTQACLSCKVNGEVRLLPNGQAGLNRLFHHYQKHATGRGLDWQLSKEQFQQLTKQACYYCGCEPGMIMSVSYTGASDYQYNGVDRIDNERGYFIDNCVTCCKMCNLAKRHIPVKDFEAWILRASDHIKVRSN